MLTATFDSYSRKQFALLGKLLVQKEPETAKKLISTFAPDEKPKEEDFSKIPEYFSLFCKANDIDQNKFFQSTSKARKVFTRRLFIGVILHLYNPQVYYQPSDQIILKYGFVRNISQVLHQKESNVSTMIREVILWERQYDDFAQSVSDIIDKLTNTAG